MRYVLKFITIILPRPTKFCQYFILLIENFNLYMASRVEEKIKLQSVDELLGVPEIAGTQEIEIGRIHAFPNHPFKVLDDEKMEMNYRQRSAWSAAKKLS